MKCLSAVALFCFIAIVSAGIRRADEINRPLVQRLKRQVPNQGGVQSFSTSSSSSSSSTQQGSGPVMFQQTSSSFNAFAPLNNAGVAAAAGTPDLLQDRFGPDDNAGNNQAANGQQIYGGHFSSVSGTYDPNTQQTIFFQNYHQKV